MNVLMLLFKDIHLDARVQREAASLAEAGYHVDIACLLEKEEKPKMIHKNVNIIRIPLTTKRVKRAIHHSKSTPILRFFRIPVIKLIKDMYAQWEYTQKVYELMMKKKYDVLHCHDLNTLPAGSYLKRKFNHIKLIYDSHELFNEMVGKNKIERWIGYLIEKKLIKNINHLITVNPYTEKFFHNRYGNIPSTIIQNTPMWDDLYFESSSRKYWRNVFPIEDDDAILLYQGGLTPQRGIEECIEALSMLPNKYKLIILGEGILRSKLEQLVRDKELHGRVFFHDPVPPSDILKYTAQADIGLVMYKNTCLNNYLSTPNKIFEYFLSGIPTVASNHPGKRYIVSKLGTGVCVEETSEAIKQGIIKIMENYEYYKSNCISKRNRYTWHIEKNKLIDLYDTLV